MRREGTGRSTGIPWRREEEELKRLYKFNSLKSRKIYNAEGTKNTEKSRVGEYRRRRDMAKKATATDAQVLLQLYDLRREPEMRRARHWWLWDFSPRSAEDFLKVAYAAGSQENNWLRQVGSYWGMAAALVLSGVVNADLFLRPAFSGEMFVIFGKLYPFLPELREKIGDPELFRDVEKVIHLTKWGRERLKFILKRIEMMREMVEQQKKGAARGEGK
jgi:hypothetical protein